MLVMDANNTENTVNETHGLSDAAFSSLVGAAAAVSAVVLCSTRVVTICATTTTTTVPTSYYLYQAQPGTTHSMVCWYTVRRHDLADTENQYALYSVHYTDVHILYVVHLIQVQCSST